MLNTCISNSLTHSFITQLGPQHRLLIHIDTFTSVANIATVTSHKKASDKTTVIDSNEQQEIRYRYINKIGRVG
jgi:hypothetical protein